MAEATLDFNTNNDTAEKWLTPLLRQLNFRFECSIRSKDAQILLNIWLSWSNKYTG